VNGVGPNKSPQTIDINIKKAKPPFLALIRPFLPPKRALLEELN